MMGSKGSATISALSAFQRMVMMMRIIDAHLVQEIADREIGGETASLIQYVLSHTPTIEAEPVRHSRWFEMVESVEDGHTGEYYEEVYYNCLNCDYATGDKTPYCPYCGCKMDKED